MQSWLENTSVAIAMCIVQQSRSRYRLDVVRGRLHSTVCMARSGLRDAFVVWLCKSETIEDHVLYYANSIRSGLTRYFPKISLVVKISLRKVNSNTPSRGIFGSKYSWRHEEYFRGLFRITI